MDGPAGREEWRLEDLSQSANQFRCLVEQSSDAIVLIDGQGIVLEWNVKAHEISGLSRGTVVGRPIWDVYNEMVSDTQRAILSRDGLQGIMDNLAQANDLTWLEMADEQEIVRPDGTPRFVQSRLFPIRTEHGVLLGAISRDVTEQKQMQAALLRSARLTAAGRLAASVAHEINNPLQSVIGCLSLARREVEKGSSLDEYLEVAQEEIQRITRTVAQIRDLHRPLIGDRQPADVNPLVAQVLDLTHKKCQNSGVEVVWQPGEALPRPVIVPDQIKQVCLNLVLNALDAMPDGGTLRVATAATSQPRGLTIDVADSGTGLAAEIQALMFEPFYSTKQEGMGLGLPISQGIVEQYGGRITFDSRLGLGSTFRVWLPA